MNTDLHTCYQNDDLAYGEAMNYFDDPVGIPEGYYQANDDVAYAAAMSYFDGEVD